MIKDVPKYLVLQQMLNLRYLNPHNQSTDTG